MKTKHLVLNYTFHQYKIKHFKLLGILKKYE